jgi:hypothetical protein
MSFEDKEAELGLLFTRMQNEPEDWRELYEVIRQKLNELKAYGMPLPQTRSRSRVCGRERGQRQAPADRQSDRRSHEALIRSELAQRHRSRGGASRRQDPRGCAPCVVSAGLPWGEVLSRLPINAQLFVSSSRRQSGSFSPSTTA